MLGMEVKPAALMTIRERLDFTIIIFNFGILVAALAFSTDFQLSSTLISFFSSNSFGISSAQILVSQKVSFISSH
jgi:FLVCR family MFS transporter 7